jgi:hypothetical protein
VVSLLLSMTTLMGCGTSASRTTSSPAEGIEVHGHWTIEVRNPDGTLAERREFDNWLHSAGGQALAAILGRQASVGGWAIQLIGSAFTSRTPYGDVGVMIVESTYPATGSNIFRTLTLTAPAIGEAASQPLRLSGTATAERDGAITQVETVMSRLAATEAPSNRYGSSAPFTSKTLDSPVSLTAGQSVTATVVITFSGPPS